MELALRLRGRSVGSPVFVAQPDATRASAQLRAAVPAAVKVPKVWEMVLKVWEMVLLQRAQQVCWAWTGLLGWMPF